MNRISRLNLVIDENRNAIRAWVHRLYASDRVVEDDLEAASWIRALPEDRQSRLDQDLAKLTSEEIDLNQISQGPLGDLLERFLWRTGVDHIPFRSRYLADDGISAIEDDLGELFQARADLKAIDPEWFEQWESFEDEVESDLP